MKHGLGLNGDFPKVCQGIIDEFDIHVEPKQKSASKKRVKNDTAGKQGKIVATYDYKDPVFDEVVYQKVRTDSKGFYIRRRGVIGEWKNGLGKT